jgi:hypothetical protein
MMISYQELVRTFPRGNLNSDIYAWDPDTGGNKMKLQDIQIDTTVRSGLNSFTGGVIIRDTKVLITLNLPDGQKTTIEGEWRHMSDANRLSERITMLCMRSMSSMRNTEQIFRQLVQITSDRPHRRAGRLPASSPKHLNIPFSMATASAWASETAPGAVPRHRAQTPYRPPWN